MTEPPRDSTGRPTPDALDLPFTDPLFQRLFPPLATGVHWGLERTAKALTELGNPHGRYPTIHVGGTNGKGSVAATLASVLDVSGLKVGLYTSPHLVHFRERFQVSGRPLGDDALEGYAGDVRDPVVRGGLTFFEAATVLAFHAFAKQAVDVGVIEVGLGGRLDATNVIHPACAVITNIALDHAEYLGPDLASIAREKAGIIKPGVPVLTADTDPRTIEMFGARARALDAPFSVLDPMRDLGDVEVTSVGTSFTLKTRAWGRLRLFTPLVGRHQAVNTALAVRALEHLPEPLRPSEEAVREGVCRVRWPGRGQVDVRSELTWLFDVAHNTAGVLSLVDVMDRLSLPRPRVALVGVLGDKDWKAMLPPILRRVEFGILTQPSSAPLDRRWDPSEVRRAVDAFTRDAACELTTELDFATALERARILAKGGSVVVTGSVHTVGSALRLLGRDPFPSP